MACVIIKLTTSNNIKKGAFMPNEILRERVNHTLLLKSKAGCLKSRNTLIEMNQGLIHNIAKRYNCNGCEYNDLFNNGVLGFIRAIEKFDSASCVTISTYATIWIRTFIDEYALNNKRMVNVHLGTLKKSRKFSKLFSSLSHLDDEAAYKIIALKEKCEVAHVEKMINLYKDDYYLSDENQKAVELSSDNVSSEFKLDLDKSMLRKIEKLDTLDKKILFMIYSKEKSIPDVANELDMTGYFLNKKLAVIYKSLRD